MARPAPVVEHLLRRAGFGATPAEADQFSGYSYPVAVNRLLEYDAENADVDQFIGTPGYVGVTVRNRFQPNTRISDARQRWLFRMVHSPAPLREKMALFWHHHFATAYSKIAGTIGAQNATRVMDAKPSEDPGGQKGQIELFREFALGNFRDLLVEVARDPAMLVWLDGRLNVRANPQENFGRELMELFTFGVEHYTEEDVYAAARVFTGWNLALRNRGTDRAYYAFNYRANQHDTGAKTFSFPIYQNGGRTISGRSAANGMQDGLDLIQALAGHPETARRLARRLWEWFVSEFEAPDPVFVDQIAGVYLASDTNMKPVMRAVMLSPQFTSPARFHQRYGWPAEFVIRSLKEVGHVGFSVNGAESAMGNMGQQLYEPPDVNGWALGPSWFSTAAMLGRMNFASALVSNQKFELRRTTPSESTQSPEALVDYVVSRLSVPALDAPTRGALVDYVRAGGNWVGSEAQVLNKAGGLFHLLTGSANYQFV
jgi:uncharacterized protein (DUF1800 family)